MLVYLDTDERDFTDLYAWLNTKPRDKLLVPTGEDSLQVLQRQAKEFLKLRWFYRVWVIQEIALSRNTCVLTEEGQTLLDEDTVTRLQYFRNYGWDMQLPVPGALRWTPGKTEHERPDLLDCLAVTNDCFASDPRDRIFAILSLLDDQTRSLVPVDYSLNLEALYAHTTAAIISQRGDLSVILAAQIWRHPETDWPSWVLDWRNSKISNLVVSTGRTSKNAGKFTSRPSYSLHPQFGHCLEVTAHYLDCITEMSKISAYAYANLSLVYWKSVEDALKPRFDTNLSRNVTPDSVNTIPLVFHAGCHENRISFADHFELIWRMNRLRSLPAVSKETVFGHVDPYEEFLEVCSKQGKRWSGSMFRTEHSIGFSSGKSSPFGEGDMIYSLAGVWTPFGERDMIYSLDGTRTPLILRKVGERHYKIMGECHLMAAFEYESWRRKGGRGPWGELPMLSDEERTHRIVLC